MALAWMTYRSEQAVINIRQARWAPAKAAIRDLLSALRSGKLIAHGIFEGERIPHPIETAIWSNFEIVVKTDDVCGPSDFGQACCYRADDGPSANPIATLHGAGGQSQEIVASGQANRSCRKAMPRVSHH